MCLPGGRLAKTNPHTPPPAGTVPWARYMGEGNIRLLFTRASPCRYLRYGLPSRGSRDRRPPEKVPSRELTRCQQISRYVRFPTEPFQGCPPARPIREFWFRFVPKHRAWPQTITADIGQSFKKVQSVQSPPCRQRPTRRHRRARRRADTFGPGGRVRTPRRGDPPDSTEMPSPLVTVRTPIP